MRRSRQRPAPALRSFRLAVAQATSRSGGLESVAYRHADPEAAAQERGRIFNQTLLNAHAYVAGELMRLLPNAQLLCPVEDVFFMSFPTAMREPDALKNLSFERLLSLKIEITKGATSK